MKRCINFILNALYGREYYAVIVGERGSDRFDLTSRIHRTPEEAEADLKNDDRIKDASCARSHNEWLRRMLRQEAMERLDRHAFGKG